MSTLGERIKRIRGDETQASFATRIGISKAALGGYERDENSPSADVISKICTKDNISPKWLIMGTGKMRDLAVLADATDDADLIMVPMVEARLSAGTGSLETSGESERSYAFRRDFICRKGNPKHMVLMRVRGDSMQPEIMNNDMVLLDQGKRQATPGPIFAVGFEDAIYLKRVDFLPGKVILKSVNPDYPPVEIEIHDQAEDMFRIIGQVIWCGREYS